jgi:hypothetical protein
MYSLDIVTGVEELRPEDLFQRETPGSANDSFAWAHAWRRENWFMEEIVRLKVAFGSFGLHVKPASNDFLRVVPRPVKLDAEPTVGRLGLPLHDGRGQSRLPSGKTSSRGGMQILVKTASEGQGL